MKWDGHTHSPYCPHGSSDGLEEYIERAIAEGFTQYSITEHAPLPDSFTDPTPDQDSAMPAANLSRYVDECHRLKQKYNSQLDIKVGLEVDYLVGFEEETSALLDQVGPKLDDALLSLHFLPVQGKWTCLDYSAERFEADILAHFESVDHVYRYYYEVMLQAVQSDLGKYKPRRIGHLTLIEKFKRAFPTANKEIWWSQALKVLEEMRDRKFQLDFNTAGLQKELCLEPYPSTEIAEVAQSLGIEFVYGSDAHQAKDVGQDYHRFIRQMKGEKE